MKRTTIFIDEGVERELQLLARRKNVPMAFLVRESFADYLARQAHRPRPKLRFVGQGRSGRKDIAERHEELLWDDFPSRVGGSKPRRGRKT